PPGGGTTTSPPDTTTTPILGVASLTLDKAAVVADSNGNTVLADAGDVITYSFVVTNTGTVTLAPVVVSDPLLPNLACTIATLAPGATDSCAATGNTYTITTADAAAGSRANTATATGDAPGTVPDPTGSDTVTTPVAATPIDAVDDTFPSINGATGGSTASVLANDTLNGVAVTRTTVTLTPGTSPNPGLSMNPDGTITIAPGTPAGTYQYPYTICEVLNPSNCDTAIATVIVGAAVIDAVDDTFPSVNGENGGTTASVLGNDTLGGVPVTPTTVTLTPGVPPNLGLTMNPDGTITIAPGTTAGTYTYPYTICEVLNPGNCDTATATVVVLSDFALRVLKTVGVREVKIGDLVRYTITVENVGTSNLVNGSVLDTPAAGFSYVEGSLSVIDGDNMATATGQSPIRFDGLDIVSGDTATLVYAMRVGAGVRPGVQVNEALATTQGGQSISNVSRAEVNLVADALVDDSLLIGTVFDDRDGDGWQDSAALGGVHVQGGFAPAAYVPNSTTVDRGAGAQPEADASSPMLHGIEVGAITARQSSADPVANHRVVIRQRLSALSFTDDFVLSSRQGVSVRMDAAGNTRVEKSGDAAKGLNGAEPTVERRVAQGEGGYVVDYVISNLGINERGIPGVRIASVEGLLIETDQFGRYHLEGIAGGDTGRGRNFILKVDPSTLPPGTVFTTDNPLVRRITPGVPVRFDFGVKLPVEEIQGGEQQVELELGEVVFAPGSAGLREQYLPVIDRIAAKVTEYRGGEVVISANGDSEALAFERAAAVKTALLEKVPADIARALTISVRAEADDPSSMVVGIAEGGPLLGTVLFDTDRSVVKPQFLPLLDKVAGYLSEKGGGSVAIVGHADPRASDAYNIALGMRRAKAVYEVLAAKLSPEVRAMVRVESSNDPAAPAGSK
ncbi:MAG: OmpA family protein, partial [Pseudoxanthomonas sp.]